MSKKEEQQPPPKPERPGYNGQEEMELLYKLCRLKKVFLGALVKPKRAPDEIKVNEAPPNLVLFISAESCDPDNIVMSDEVTESLSVSAKFLLEELKVYNG